MHPNISHMLLTDGSVRDTTSKGRFVQGTQYPRNFGRGHIGRGHIYLGTVVQGTHRSREVTSQIFSSGDTSVGAGAHSRGIALWLNGDNTYMYAVRIRVFLFLGPISVQNLNI
jgi:hypothetical protein